MKLCDTCIYRNENEYHKPCIVYRDDCELYEKAREYMSKQFLEMIDRYESNGHELKFVEHSAILIRCKDCDHCLDYGDCLVCNRGALDISADDYCSKAIPKRETEAMTKSNSEEDIYKGCLRLMGSLTCKFFDWLNYIGVDVRNLSEEEQFCVKYDTKEIVEMLFLFETPYKNCPPVEKMKCEELDIDANKSVSFDFSDELESEMLD